MNLLERVLIHEGFSDQPYRDHLGKWTIGHGLTWISEAESRMIVSERLVAIRYILEERKPFLTVQPQEVSNVTTEMAFQMGVTGCLNFKKMWKALEEEDYARASDEMMDSKWAHQTPERARELAQIIREAQ